MRPAGHHAHRVDHPGRQHHAVDLRAEAVHDLLDGHDGPLAGQHALFLHAADAPEHHVAFPVGLLGVDDPDVGIQRRHRGQLLARERAGDAHDGLGDLGEACAHTAAQHPEGQPGGPGPPALGHVGVAVLAGLDEARIAVLDGVAHAVQRAHAGVAAPGEDQLAGTACADHLVVDHVGGHAHQGQVSPVLPDDLVARREGDQVREPLQGHGVAVMHIGRDRLGEPAEHGFGHQRALGYHGGIRASTLTHTDLASV